MKGEVLVMVAVVVALASAFLSLAAIAYLF